MRKPIANCTSGSSKHNQYMHPCNKQALHISFRIEYPECSHTLTLFLLCLHREWMLLYSMYIFVFIHKRVFTCAGPHKYISLYMYWYISDYEMNDVCVNVLNIQCLSLLVQCLCQRFCQLRNVYLYFVLS